MRATHWAFTLWGTEARMKATVRRLSQLKNLRTLLISCKDYTKNGKVHWHGYARFWRDVPRSVLGDIKGLGPLYKNPEHSRIEESAAAYCLYMTQKGPSSFTLGEIPQVKEKKKESSKSAKVLELVQQGWRMTEILEEYPGMERQIAKLMKWRPHRKHKTWCQYIHRPRS